VTAVAEARLELAAQATGGGVGGEVRVPEHGDTHVVGRRSAREPRDTRMERRERGGGIDERRNRHVDNRQIRREPRHLGGVDRGAGRGARVALRGCRIEAGVLRRRRIGGRVLRGGGVRRRGAPAGEQGEQRERSGLPGPHGGGCYCAARWIAQIRALGLHFQRRRPSF
jgi:hypothetical protein